MNLKASYSSNVLHIGISSTCSLSNVEALEEIGNILFRRLPWQPPRLHDRVVVDDVTFVSAN